MIDKLPIYVFGNGEIYWEVFNAVAASVGGAGYSSLLRITIIFAAFYAVILYIKSRDITVKVMWVFQYFVLYVGLFVPTTTVKTLNISAAL